MPESEVPGLAIVVPVHNEAENIGPLIDEIAAACAGGGPYEIVVVDDCSSDDTLSRLTEKARVLRALHVVRHARNAGQSTAIHSGVRFARARLIATIDGDGQNDPTDIPALLEAYRTRRGTRPLLVAGHRVDRLDTFVTRASSRIANAVRATLLSDRTPDTGCGLKLFERETFLALPYFDHMHRFLPALVLRAGGDVVSVPVRHRPRLKGRSHYGIHNRLWTGLVDLAGVMWLTRRSRQADAVEQTPHP